jgi:hypothetical protein
MTVTLTERLNEIEGRITNPSFLSSEGIGNEIACYIFDYPARDELLVRDHLAHLQKRLATHHSSLDVLHLNLFDVIIAYLKERNLFDKTLSAQASKGDAGVLRMLSGVVKAEKICQFIAATYHPSRRDLILISGVGSAWPMMRAHSLLNGLHSVMDNRPMVLFYPGTFDGTTLRLFGKIETEASKPGSKPYYRAFRLIPGREAE